MFDLLTSTTMARLPTLGFGDSLLFDVFCALAVHKIYNKYEVDPADFLPTFLLLVGVPVLPSSFLSAHMESRTYALLTSFALFYAVLVFSIILYRISPFHPLAKYPGPLPLKISKFAMMYRAWNGKQHTYWKSLHDKYGPYVRVGPNELSIVDIDAIPPILGPDGMRRGPEWIIHVPPGTAPSIAELRDVDLHHERRKLWNHGFTSSSLKELQPTVESRVLQLVEELGKRTSKEGEKYENVVDLAQWVANFTYDFMGDMVFGGGFHFMRVGDTEGVRELFEAGLKLVGILEHIPWLTRILDRVFGKPEAERKFRAFAAQCFDKRVQKGATRRDLFHYITNEEGLEDVEVPRHQALGDITTAIVAGADTTATVLAGLFYYLLARPPSYERLRDELDSTFPLGEGEPFDTPRLAGMPYLNAVINEALRLQPPLATALQRSPIEGSGGKMVAGRFISESTAVYIPPYVLHRDERYFSPSPNEFIPERWIDDSGKFRTNTSAHIPFSVGPANCVGKNLALMEMRMLVASILQKFDIRFAEGYDPREWEESVKDHFLVKVEQLPVVLHARK